MFKNVDKGRSSFSGHGGSCRNYMKKGWDLLAN
jgi:hypothetical protein